MLSGATDYEKKKKNREKKILGILWRKERKFFHFIFHFHYLPGESINARRIREITWTLAFPGLVLIHPSWSSTLPLPLTQSFLIHCYPNFVVWLSLFHWSVLLTSVLVCLASIKLLLSCQSCYLLEHDPLSCIAYSISVSLLFKHLYFFFILV